MLLRVLQGEAHPSRRLLQLGRRRLLGTFFLLDLRRLDALLRLDGRHLDHLEQVGAAELLQRLKDGFEVNGRLERLDGFNGFGGGRHFLFALGELGCLVLLRFYYVSLTLICPFFAFNFLFSNLDGAKNIPMYKE